MRARLARLARAQSGAALAEFALVAPFMMLILFGSIEALQAIETQRRVAHISSAIADLVAQNRIVTDSDLADVFQAGGLLMDPLPATTLGQRVTSFTADSGGTVKADWTADAPTPYAGTESLTLPNGYLKANQSVVVADVSYTYQPALKWLLPSTLLFQKRVYLHPRLTTQVIHQAG